MKKKIVLIGLGKIGMMYDFDKPNLFFLSYAKALKQSKKFKFIGAVDISEKKRKLFQKKYNIKTFKTIDNLLNELNPDIVVISTPTKSHLEIIMKLINFKKNITILCEKPVTDNYKKITKIEKFVKGKNIKIFTNYMRLADPKVLRIKSFITKTKSNFFCEVFYNGTLLNSCSHYISLIINLFGTKYKIEVLKKEKNFFDFKLIFKNCEVMFFSSSMRKINYEDIRIINKKRVIYYKNGGQEIIEEKANLNPIYKIGNHYNLSKRITDNFYKQSQKFTVDQLESLFKNKKILIANLKHAKNVHYLIKKIYEKKK